MYFFLEKYLAKEKVWHFCRKIIVELQKLQKLYFSALAPNHCSGDYKLQVERRESELDKRSQNLSRLNQDSHNEES